jgi:hypothetical protein
MLHPLQYCWNCRCWAKYRQLRQNNMSDISPEEEIRIKALKEQKRVPWSAAAWEDASLRIHKPRPPRIHLIILQAPLGAPAVIKQVASLSEIPVVEQTKTVPEDGEKEEAVSFCRLGDNGYSAICEWLDRSPTYFLKAVYIVFEGERKAAWKPIFAADDCVGD